jgi:AcrR family transcriptional regulator
MEMPAPTAPNRRADRVRNHARLLAVASALIARDGAEVSLEEIARQAGVGSATLHRHFPSRRALLEEVFSDGIERLAQRATELVSQDPQAALFVWLEELTAYAASTRGLSESLTSGHEDPNVVASRTCRGRLRQAAKHLTALAITEGMLRPSVSPDDVLMIANGISLVTPDDPAAARRLVRIAIAGLSSMPRS